MMDKQDWIIIAMLAMMLFAGFGVGFFSGSYYVKDVINYNAVVNMTEIKCANGLEPLVFEYPEKETKNVNPSQTT